MRSPKTPQKHFLIRPENLKKIKKRPVGRYVALFLFFSLAPLVLLLLLCDVWPGNVPGTS
jgi:hypothetical protein